MRKIGIPEIEDIATGAALLGAGGGGDPYVGKLVAIGAVQACGPVTLLDPEEVPDDALVIPMTEEPAAAIAAATTLRAAGVRTQLYCEKKKFKAKMSYADKIGVPFAVLLGEDEINEGVVSVKNMTSGEQVKLTPADAAAMIKAAVDARNQAAVIKEN